MLRSVDPDPTDRVLLSHTASRDGLALIPERRGRTRSAALRKRRRSHVVGHRAQDGSALRPGQLNVDAIAPDWQVTAMQSGSRAAVVAVTRRMLDVAISLAALVVLMPVLVLIAVLVRVDSPGPALYRQQRVGLAGRPFTLLKFRSMRLDAEAAGPCWAAERDPRVTRLGRWLRRTRLDELPQLLCVLNGAMSLVGPRPERPHFVDELTQAIPHFGLRTLVKPGITGWAQVNYPYGASVADARHKLAYDLFYIQHRSLLLDLSITFATLNVMLQGEGAR